MLTATIASRPISFFFGSMVACRVADTIKYVLGLQAVHTIFMAALLFIVLLMLPETIASRPLSFFPGSMVACHVADNSNYVLGV
jgi:hypothetical protein